MCLGGESTRLDTHFVDFIDPVLEGRVPPNCTGTSLDDAVCNATLETGCGCASAQPSNAPGLLGFLAFIASRRRS